MCAISSYAPSKSGLGAKPQCQAFSASGTTRHLMRVFAFPLTVIHRAGGTVRTRSAEKIVGAPSHRLKGHSDISSKCITAFELAADALSRHYR